MAFNEVKKKHVFIIHLTNVCILTKTNALMYKTKNPTSVLSPRDCIQSVKVLFDGKNDPAFSVAVVEWQGVKNIGIRWNINLREWGNTNKKSGIVECLGEPNSRGYPTWFMIPEELLTSLLINDELGQKIKDALEEINETR